MSDTHGSEGVARHLAVEALEPRGVAGGFNEDASLGGVSSHYRFQGKRKVVIHTPDWCDLTGSKNSPVLSFDRISPGCRLD